MIDATPAVVGRISTGNVELDAVLAGGLPESSLNVILGEPGSGKTTLAEAFVFANANDARRPILYFTTLSEPLEKVMRYLQQFTFFDAGKIGSTVLYEGLGDELAAKGVGALVPRIREAIKRHSPKVIVIDSFKAIHDLSTSASEMRLMLHDLVGLFAAFNVTVMLVGEYRHEDIAIFPEFAMADGIIELARNALGTRDERYLRVFKLRGSAYQQGTHAFEITPGGLKVYPRLVSPALAAPYQRSRERAASGVPGLDSMLAGGLWAGSSTVVAGPTGSGKTTLGIQFVVEGVRRGERCMLVNLQENPTQLAQSITEISGQLDADAKSRLALQYYSAVELPIDRIVVGIFETIARGGVKRVVIDALGDLAAAARDPARLHNYLYALVQHFSVLGVSSLLTLETDSAMALAKVADGTLSHLTDNIVMLDVRERDGVVGRTLRIVKARGLAHDLQPRQLHIDARGVKVSGGEE